MAVERRTGSTAQIPSTPPLTPAQIQTPQNNTNGQIKPPNGPEPLTPPTSPLQNKSSSKVVDLSSSQLSINEQQTPISPRNSAELFDSARLNVPKDIDNHEQTALECPFDLEILKDNRGNDQVFGHGAWSTVYKAIAQSKAVLHLGFGVMSTESPSVAPMLVAVKKPARKDAVIILKNEAKILSYLSTMSGHERYIIPFYGTCPDKCSIVMGAVTQSLENYIESCAQEVFESSTSLNFSEPVIGPLRKWLQLAQLLVSALVWLHEDAGVVHGDVKPANILIRPVTESHANFPFEPLFADFSSGQLLNVSEPTPNTLSAITREYTAPELLKISVLSDPKSTATTDTDIFSMAVTLLVAATGETLVYPGSVFQRQMMATQGWQILNYVRNGPQGTRVPRHGLVEKVLEQAVLKAGMGRIHARQWLKLIDEQILGEPSKL